MDVPILELIKESMTKLSDYEVRIHRFSISESLKTLHERSDGKDADQRD
jgi:hypothetical protein